MSRRQFTRLDVLRELNLPSLRGVGHEKYLQQMADEPTPNPFSPDPTGGTGREEVSAEELDALLAEASALASEISNDLGEPGEEMEAEPRESTEGEQSLPEPIGLTDGVDTQLQRIDGFVAEARSELGASPEPPEEPTKSDQAPSPASEERALPAFMDDLTSPVDDSASPAAEDPGNPSAEFHEPEPRRIAARQSVPPEPETPDPPVWAEAPAVSDPLAEGSGPAPNGPPQPIPHEKMSADEPTLPGAPLSTDRVGAIHRAAARLSAVALGLCNCGVQLLEMMDRPVRRLGPGPRHAIGWLAIATLGTSFIVFAVSLF